MLTCHLFCPVGFEEDHLVYFWRYEPQGFHRLKKNGDKFLIIMTCDSIT